MDQYLPVLAFVLFVGSIAWMCWRMNAALRLFEAEADRLRELWADEEARLEADARREMPG